jgi:serine/threonine protein phosphatase PrpC
MTESSTPRADPVDVLLVVVIAASGAAVVRSFAADVERWWAPGAIALAVGLLIAVFAPRPIAVPVSAERRAPLGLGDPLLPPPTPATARPFAPPVDPDATHLRVRRAPQNLNTDRFEVRILSLPKLGNDQDENEDGWFVTTDVRRLAVADGASSAFASRQWSKILTESFASDPRIELSSTEGRMAFVEACSQRWHAAVAGNGDWWSNEARGRGSFAALVAVELAEDLTFVASAVGDCCLMLCDESDRLRLSFPVDSAAAFDSTPSLLATNAPDLGDWRRASGRLAPGQSLVLVSDAMAEWLLKDSASRLPWLLGSDEAAWAQALVAVRERNDMVNDDVTVVVARCRRSHE